ncbi:MAG: LytTR family DNA-binding domain-containing protein [Eubacteriales bacterium]|nr:LytTR family DNA-binding domain-containing protein [Eubacteriales bacterium]
MQIEIQTDIACKEPKIIIITDKMNDEVQDILKRLSTTAPQILLGLHEDIWEILEEENIVRFYTAGGKVFAESKSKEYQLRLRLYELEEKLSHALFIRISNTEIINIKQARSFDLSLSGTVCVTMSNGTVAYVSRRYVSKIKKILGI